MTVRICWRWPNGRDAADGEAGQLARLVRGRAPDARLRQHGGQKRQSTGWRRWPGPGTAASPSTSLGDEDEALDDLADLGAHGARGLVRRVRGLVEEDDLELDALSLGGVEHALGRDGYRVHGGREDSIGLGALQVPAGTSYMVQIPHGTGERHRGAESAAVPQTLGT